MELNKEQNSAVEHIEGPLLIIAGAGTGKTRVVSERILNLLKKEIAKPGEILALTFSEKAAREMEERVDLGMPLGYEEISMSTFHAFAQNVLRESGLNIGIDPGFEILSGAEQWFFFKKNIFEFELDYYRPLGNPNKFIYEILDHFGKLKDELISPEAYLEYAEKNEEEDREQILELAKAYKKYQELLIRHNYLDFGDLISYAIMLFEKRPNVLKEYQNRYKFIHVDEFQDTNYAQFQLVLKLAERDKNIVVVGDDDQSIYKWRGASLSNILQFQKHFPGHKSVVLSENYRSTQTILDSAYTLIQNNNPDRLEVKTGINKKLNGHAGEGEKVEIHQFPLFNDEVSFVGETIRELKKQEGLNYKDFAVLVRANNHAHPFIDEFKYLGIPYQVKSPKGLFSLDEIKDLIAILKFLANNHDDIALLRVLKMEVFGIQMANILKLLNLKEKDSLFNNLNKSAPSLFDKNGWDPTTVQKFLAELIEFSKKKSVGEVMNEFIQKSKYLENLVEREKFEEMQNVNEFAKQVSKFEKENFLKEQSGNSVVDFVNYLGLLEDSNSNFPTEEFLDRDSVQILSTHGSKGLEFKYVFVVNAVKERFPSRGKRDLFGIPEALTKEIYPEGDVHIQEERRLFYVAMTRAREKLFITYSAKYEGNKVWKPSPFVKEVLAGKKAVLVEHEMNEDAIEKLKKENVVVNKSIFDLPPFSKGKISYSKLNTFRTCPLKYSYNYMLKIPAPSGHADNFGSSVHNTLKEFYQHMKQGIECDLKLLDDIYQKNWLPFGYESKDHENAQKAKGWEILTGYYETNREPWTIPAFIERNFNLKIGEYWLSGRIDRIDKLPDGTYEVVDYKTGRIKSDTNPFKDLQLSIYALACRDIFKIKASKLTLYFLEENERLSAGRTDDQLKKVKEEILNTIKEMEKSDFAPIPGFHCGYCPYKIICPAV